MSKNNAESSLQQNIFRENEVSANRYTANCLIGAAVICVLMWVLNLIGFFRIPSLLMNTFMPIGIVCFLIPIILERTHKLGGHTLRYVLILSFILGLTLLAIAMPRHLILAWACPVILSCHYYAPKFTRFTLIVTLFAMSAAVFLGIYLGEWEPNVMDQVERVEGVMQRHEYLMMRMEEGNNLLLSALNFYVLPRSAILCLVYMISNTLSRRTARLLERQAEAVGETERISTELNVANHIQTSMLPDTAFPDKKEFDICATMHPAKEVGGDFYDFFMVDDRHLAIVMADVSGKGVPAALFMVIGKTLIKDHTQPDKTLGEVFTKVNELLCESNSEGLFITAFEGVLDLVTGEFNFVNAGHEWPYLCKANGTFEVQKIRSGFVLAGMDGQTYRAGSITLEPGDKIFQYTDGVTEATDADNRLYGMDRLTAALNMVCDKSPHEILPAVQKDIDAFVGDAPQFDDITMLCLEYKEKMKL